MCHDRWMSDAACSSIVGSDAVRMCEELSGQIANLTWHPWVTAMIGVLAAGLTAYLSTRGSLHANRTDRRNLSQRDALYGAQDATQELLKRWTQFKDWNDTGCSGTNPLPSFEEQYLLGVLDKEVSRISNERIRTNFYIWRDTARYYFQGFENYDRHEEIACREKAIKEAGRWASNLDR